MFVLPTSGFAAWTRRSTARAHSGCAHPDIEPAPVSEDMLDVVCAATEHGSDRNPHATDLSRMAEEPSVAAALYLLLTDFATLALDNLGRFGDQMCLDCTVDSYVKHGVLQASDREALEAVQTRIARQHAGFSAEPTGTELALLHHDPQALVRAAYVLYRRVVVLHWD